MKQLEKNPHVQGLNFYLVLEPIHSVLCPRRRAQGFSELERVLYA